MRIGFDLDGVLTLISRHSPNIKIPWWIFLGLIFMIPDKKMVDVLRKLDKRDIIIVSARPKQLESLTRMWFRFHKIPFHNLFCVGLGKGENQRKLEVIKLMKIEKFIDSDERVVEFLRENSVNAYSVRELFR